MRVAMATSSGHVGRSNEDFVGAVPDAVVLLDGAGLPGTDVICRHGVAWYAQTLGTTLLARLTRDGESTLSSHLADAIDTVADRHRHTCELTDPSSPQATVAMVRLRADCLDYLVLADAYVVLAQSDRPPTVLTDSREVQAQNECGALLDGLREGTPEYDRAWATAVRDLRARRNQPDGYWIAKDDPEAAAQAVTGTIPLREIDAVALLSNGASRVVAPYCLADWPTVIDQLRTHGPGQIIRAIRRVEECPENLPGFEAPDDVTVAFCDLTASVAAH